MYRIIKKLIVFIICLIFKEQKAKYLPLVSNIYTFNNIIFIRYAVESLHIQPSFLCGLQIKFLPFLNTIAHFTVVC